MPITGNRKSAATSANTGTSKKTTSKKLWSGVAAMLLTVILWIFYTSTVVESTPHPVSNEASYPQRKDSVEARPTRAQVIRGETIAEFPHDEDAFTQGLQFYKGELYESTGLYGRSSIRKVDLGTGKVLRHMPLEKRLFGEGIVIWQDKIWLLTWREHKVLVLKYDTFEIIQEHPWPHEGWGICHDNHVLIVSVGTHMLYFVNATTFEVIKEVAVTAHDKQGKRRKLRLLNELEYIDGFIYANLWMKTQIAVIDPQTGHVVQWLDYAHLKGMKGDVMNGIAFNHENRKLYVTGKLWPKLFETRLASVVVPHFEQNSTIHES